MIKLNKISLDYEPRKKILPKLENNPQGYRNPEMSEFDSAFLCGLLESYRPKKILEVGVASGATTSIILQVLEDIGKSYEMHSVDASANWYRDRTKPTGFMTTFAKENNLFSRSALCGKYEYPLENNLFPPLPVNLSGSHEFHLGKYLPQVIDEIGGDIDFVILDTVHSLPGEVLDFPVMLPYLKDGAIVALHDVSYNHVYLKWHGYATTTVLCSVTAEEKFINFETETEHKPYRYPNIAAFSISEQTRKYIENLFLSLVITWSYIPDDKQLEIYREFYKGHYPAELVDIFNEAIKMNVDRMAKQQAAK